MIERINGYFGFKAVAGLRITQGPLPKAGERRRAGGRAPAQGEGRTPAGRLVDVAEPAPRRSLEALGRAVIRRKRE